MKCAFNIASFPKTVPAEIIIDEDINFMAKLKINL